MNEMFYSMPETPKSVDSMKIQLIQQISIPGKVAISERVTLSSLEGKTHCYFNAQWMFIDIFMGNRNIGFPWILLLVAEKRPDGIGTDQHRKIIGIY